MSLLDWPYLPVILLLNVYLANNKIHNSVQVSAGDYPGCSVRRSGNHHMQDSSWHVQGLSSLYYRTSGLTWGSTYIFSTQWSEAEGQNNGQYRRSICCCSFYCWTETSVCVAEFRVQSSASCGFVEEAVDVLGGGLAHDGLQLGGVGVAELLDTGEVLQQGQSFDPAHPGDLLDHGEDQRVQEPRRSPPPERVLPALPVNLERTERKRACWEIGSLVWDVVLVSHTRTSLGFYVEHSAFCVTGFSPVSSMKLSFNPSALTASWFPSARALRYLNFQIAKFVMKTWKFWLVEFSKEIYPDLF